MLICGALTAASAQAPLISAQQIARAEARAVEHVSNQARAWGIEPGDLTVARSDSDALGLIHVRLQQTFRRVPVFGGEAIVHIGRDGEVSGVTNSLVANVSVNTVPGITIDAARASALAATGCADCVTDRPEADLWILRHDGRDHLTYRVRFRIIKGGAGPALPVVFIDAHDGRVVRRYNNLQTASDRGI